MAPGMGKGNTSQRAHSISFAAKGLVVNYGDLGGGGANKVYPVLGGGGGGLDPRPH